MSNISFNSGPPKFRTKKIEFNTSEYVELQEDELRMYNRLFDEDENPGEVRKPLQRSLRKFVDEGLLEDNYYKFVKLCHQAVENNFDSVKKNGLHVINNEGDVSLICAETKPEWKVICTLEKGNILKFYKNKNLPFGSVLYDSSSSTSVSISSGTTASNTHWVVKK